MAKSDKFISNKDSKGAVTLTRRGGAYDKGDNPKLSRGTNEATRGVHGSASAEVIGREKGNSDRVGRAAKAMRDATTDERTKYFKK